MTIAFYDGGVRVVDLAGLATGQGLKEIASYRTGNANTWSFKAPRVTRDGVFYAYGNDINRGLDVYRVDLDGAPSKTPGTWLPGRTTQLAAQRRVVALGHGRVEGVDVGVEDGGAHGANIRSHSHPPERNAACRRRNARDPAGAGSRVLHLRCVWCYLIRQFIR